MSAMYLHTNTSANDNQVPFQPTWLYIKQHNKTGLKYFGKTTLDDPITYLGSGKYWRAHLRKHGKDVTTLWCGLFFNKEVIVEEATSFSRAHNIVKAKNKNGKKIWANEKPENGLDGNLKGCAAWNKDRPHTNETKEKIRVKATGRKQSDLAKEKKSIASLAAVARGRKPHSLESFKKSGDTQRGKKRPDISLALKGRTPPEERVKKMRETILAMGGTNKTPVTINNITYACKNDACSALNISLYKLNKML